MGGSDSFNWVGSTIADKFVVEAIAGEGAFGLVYRGRHLGFDAPIAIKFLKIPASLEEEQREQFLASFRREAQLLHRLSRLTTGIVQALDVGAATSPSGEWTPYTVMEWLEGETLEHFLRQRRASGQAPLSLIESIRLLTPAAEALAVAHDDNVSHRDVKPGNLFLTKIRGGSMKVLDFGIAKVFAETPTFSAILARTGKSFHAFTPQYGAPEQFSDKYGATGPWTDVYALALILIEVASGRFALTGGDMVQLFVASIDATKRPSLTGRGVSSNPEIDAVVARALSIHPALRFRTAGEMWAALEVAAQSLSLNAQRAPLPSRPPPGPTHDPPYQGTTQGPPAKEDWATAGGENRVCTVMFIDFSAATELSDRLDPEEVKDIADGCFKTAVEQVVALGGLVNRVADDCAMAIFGLPRAADNDAERAVHAALRIQTAVARLPLPKPVRSTRLTARIGVNTGRVFAMKMSGGAGQEAKVSGETVSVAMRLQQVAAKSVVAIGRDTYRHVMGLFNMEPLPALDPRGRGESFPVHRVLNAIPFRHALVPTDFYGLETKLVGRSAEKQRLLDVLEAVTSEPRAALVTVVGPPGVGRSRILAELFSSLLNRSELFFVMTAQCSSLAKDTSYGLAASLIRRRFGIDETDAPEIILRKLRRGVRWFQMFGARDAGKRAAFAGLDLFERDRFLRVPGDELVEIDATLQQVAAVLGVPSGDAGDVDSMNPNEGGSQAKHRISAALALLLGSVAARVPVVIVCDDIHWADDASLDLLNELILRVGDLPLMIVCAARLELYDRRPHWGEGEAAHQRVDIAPLARRPIEDMIRNRLRNVPDLSVDLVRLVADRAEGNPLTVEETLHLLVDAGVIETRSAGPWVVRESRLGALALPPTMQGIVQARLDRLEQGPRGVLGRAAVIGRTFWEGAVEHLQQSGMPDTPTAATLAKLRERQLIRAKASATFPGEHEFVFAESATQEVAYEAMALKVRRSLHLLIAAWLEVHAPGNAGAALRALHYDRGGDLKRAASEHARVASHAASLGQNQEALRHFERARDLYDEAEDGGALARPAGAPAEDTRMVSWHERVRLRLDLGDVLRHAGRLDDAERTYEEARTRILRRERRNGETVDPADLARWDARVDFRLALVHKVGGATKKGCELVARAIEQATEGGSIEETPAMYALLVILEGRDRRPEDSWRTALKGLRVCRSIQRRDARWREDVAQLLLGVAISLYRRGRMVRAERIFWTTARVLKETARPDIIGNALNGVAAARIATGDLTGAREIFLRSLRMKERAGDLHQISVAYNNVAEAELRMKDFAAALEHARESVRLGEQIHARSDLADMYRNLAEASLGSGEFQAALEAGCKALEIAEVAGRVYLGDVAVTLARICVAVAGKAAPGSPLLAQVMAAVERLRASLDVQFKEGDLASKAEECRALLDTISARE